MFRIGAARGVRGRGGIGIRIVGKESVQFRMKDQCRGDRKTKSTGR